MSHQENLRSKPVKPLLWSLAIPAISAMMLNSLYGIIDGIFVGLATGEEGIAAITIVTPVMYIIFALALMFSIGSGSIYSRAIGARNFEKAKAVANSTLIHMFIVGFLFTVFGLLFAEDIGYLFGMQDSFKVETMNYLNVIFYGTLPLFFAVFYNNIFRAEGAAKIAMISMMIGTIVNIILDPILIFGFDMGTLGAAVATVVGYIISFIFGLTMQFVKKFDFRLNLKYLRWDINILIETVNVGMAALIRNSIGAIVVITINNLLNLYAQDPVIAIAVYGIFMRMSQFFGMPAFGMNQALMPIVGYNFGAKQYNRVTSTRHYTTRVMTLYFIIFYAIYFIFAKQVIMMFGVSGEAIEYGVSTTRMAFVGLTMIGVQIVLSGYYQALGRAKMAIVLTLLRQVMVLLPLAVILGSIYGEIGVWIALPISDISSSLIAWAIYIGENRIFHKKELELEKSTN